MPLIRKAPPAVPTTEQPSRATAGALTSGTDDERWAAARAAGDVPEAARAIGDAIPRERNARVREAMFTSLIRIGTSESIEALLPLVRSDDSSVRTGALDALRALDDKVQPYVAQLMGDDDSDVRLLACELLRALPADVACGLLCELMDREREPNVCAAALEVLSEVGGPEALPILARCEARFQGIPFLVFSITSTAERIRSQTSAQRG